MYIKNKVGRRALAFFTTLAMLMTLLPVFVIVHATDDISDSNLKPLTNLVYDLKSSNTSVYAEIPSASASSASSATAAASISSITIASGTTVATLTSSTNYVASVTNAVASKTYIEFKSEWLYASLSQASYTGGASKDNLPKTSSTDAFYDVTITFNTSPTSVAKFKIYLVDTTPVPTITEIKVSPMTIKLGSATQAGTTTALAKITATGTDIDSASASALTFTVSPTTAPYKASKTGAEWGLYASGTAISGTRTDILTVIANFGGLTSSTQITFKVEADDSTDGNGGTTTQPSITSLTVATRSSLYLSEAVSPTQVATITTITSPTNLSSGVVYTLTGASVLDFKLDGNKVLVSATSLSVGTYSLTIKASHTSVTTVSKDFSIVVSADPVVGPTIGNVTFTGGGTGSVRQYSEASATQNTKLGTFGITGTATANEVTYTLSGQDASKFTVDTSTKELKVSATSVATGTNLTLIVTASHSSVTQVASLTLTLKFDDSVPPVEITGITLTPNSIKLGSATQAGTTTALATLSATVTNIPVGSVSSITFVVTSPISQFVVKDGNKLYATGTGITASGANTITVKATLGTASKTQDVTLTVTDDTQSGGTGSPTDAATITGITLGATSFSASQAKAGDRLTGITVTTTPANLNVTVSLLASGNGNRFVTSGTNLYVSSTNLDPGSYSITLRATHPSVTQVKEETFTITITADDTRNPEEAKSSVTDALVNAGVEDIATVTSVTNIAGTNYAKMELTTPTQPVLVASLTAAGASVTNADNTPATRTNLGTGMKIDGVTVVIRGDVAGTGEPIMGANNTKAQYQVDMMIQMIITFTSGTSNLGIAQQLAVGATAPAPITMSNFTISVTYLFNLITMFRIGA